MICSCIVRDDGIGSLIPRSIPCNHNTGLYWTKLWSSIFRQNTIVVLQYIRVFLVTTEERSSWSKTLSAGMCKILTSLRVRIVEFSVKMGGIALCWKLPSVSRRGPTIHVLPCTFPCQPDKSAWASVSVYRKIREGMIDRKSLRHGSPADTKSHTVIWEFTQPDHHRRSTPGKLIGIRITSAIWTTRLVVVPTLIAQSIAIVRRMNRGNPDCRLDQYHYPPFESEPVFDGVHVQITEYQDGCCCLLFHPLHLLDFLDFFKPKQSWKSFCYS